MTKQQEIRQPAKDKNFRQNTDEPTLITIPSTKDVTLKALSWGPAGAPVAICLHGFPDTAYGWQKVAVPLVNAGWRVVAPFMRGYSPSSLSLLGSYHIGALMDDALRTLEAVGPTGKDVIIGQDWGAVAGSGLAAMPGSPFVKAVTMSVPPVATFRGKVPRLASMLILLPRQLMRSWYAMYFQLPFLPEFLASWIVPMLWRRWDPAYDSGKEVAFVLEALGQPKHWKAALSYYRTIVWGGKAPVEYAALHAYWMLPPLLPTLYLHGANDGAFGAGFAPWVKRLLPPGSSVHVVDHAGHFLQADCSDDVANRILEFIGHPKNTAVI